MGLSKIPRHLFLGCFARSSEQTGTACAPISDEEGKIPDTHISGCKYSNINIPS